MNRVIHKYPLKPAEFHAISMPADAEIIAVHVQHNDPCVWAIVDPEAPHELVNLRVVGTGQPFDAAGLQHVGTFQMLDGGLVFHVFRVVGGIDG